MVKKKNKTDHHMYGIFYFHYTTIKQYKRTSSIKAETFPCQENFEMGIETCPSPLLNLYQYQFDLPSHTMVCYCKIYF